MPEAGLVLRLAVHGDAVHGLCKGWRGGQQKGEEKQAGQHGQDYGVTGLSPHVQKRPGKKKGA